MTTLSTGSSVTFSVGDGGSVVVSTNGGLASVSVTPTSGPVQTFNLGPLAVRQTFGPYSEGATITITNSTAGLDYDYQGAALTAAQLVSIGTNLFASNLIQTAIPFVFPPSGTIGNNGALTLPAIDATRASCYMYFPANAIAAGVPAGWRYVAMSSTTAGTIYQDLYTSGKPVVPATPTPWVTTGPGAYTQTTNTDIAGPSIVVPGLVMGVNGFLRCWVGRTHNNSVGAKVGRLRLNGISYLAANLTTSVASNGFIYIANAGVYNRQRITQDNNGDQAISPGGNYIDRAVDTSVNQVLDYSFNIATATDYMTLERLLVELFPMG